MDDMNNCNTTTTLDNDAAAATTLPPPATPAGNSNHPIFFDDDQLDHDISASIYFTPSPSFSLPHHHQYFNNNQEVLFSMSSSTFNNNIQISLGDHDVGQPYTADHHHYNPDRRTAAVAPLIPTGNYKEESGCFMSSSVCVPSYNIRMMSSIDPMNIGSYFIPSTSCLSTAPFSFDSSCGISFTAGTAGFFLGNDVSVHDQELGFHGDNIGGIFQPDSAMARVFNCSTGDLQALSSESQQYLLHGSPSTTLASEISSLEDPNFKVDKLSVEERKRKIHRYLKKRNERNFNKKIKYACRKTLADSRPRVRGRFAKNDELAEIAARSSSSTGNYNHEDIDTDEDVTLFSNPNITADHKHKVVKGEEDFGLLTMIITITAYVPRSGPALGVDDKAAALDPRFLDKF